LLVKVTTDQGLEDPSEAFGFRAVRSAKFGFEELIAPICIGKDATTIGALMIKCSTAKKLHTLGANRALVSRAHAADIALMDNAGKDANAPLSRLLSGGVADVGYYASLIRYSDPYWSATTDA
jgi:L-alanine-DL-glutamate epimerase-like enolase superfamily enzyme